MPEGGVPKRSLCGKDGVPIPIETLERTWFRWVGIEAMLNTRTAVVGLGLSKLDECLSWRALTLIPQGYEDRDLRLRLLQLRNHSTSEPFDS